MAQLTSDELVDLRRAIQDTPTPINVTKPQINAALQAVEDWVEGNRAALSSAINAATSPTVLTNAQKKRLVAFYFEQKHRRDLV